jgi:hypothetical protein
MKKNILKLPLCFAMLFILISMIKVQAQTAHKMIINVKEIEYDDPNFVALRESLKKNSKVKLVKPSYSSGVATLSFTYPGEAAQLWDELPKTSKRFFKLSDMSDDAISLAYSKPSKSTGSTTASASTSQSKSTNKKDCLECEYFPLCKFDVTKSFGGNIYKGLREEDGTIKYYYCDNGVVTMKWETIYTSPAGTATDYDPISNTSTVIYYQGEKKYELHTRVFLKFNAPEGSSWESDGIRFSLVKKDTSITIDGKLYNHVIVVREGVPFIYYVKGIGRIKELNYVEYFKSEKGNVFEKGTIDPAIIGTWVEDKDPGYWSSTYIRFFGNGKGESGGYDMRTNILGKPTPFKWCVIGNTLYRQYECEEQVCFFEGELKKIDTGIDFSDTKYRKL